VIRRPRRAAPGRLHTSVRRRRRRRFSVNGLAIQLSAFALSSTLVALLVVSGSQAAFVEENEIVTQYEPVGTPAPTEGGRRRPVAGGPPRAAEPLPEPTVTVTPDPELTEEPLVDEVDVEVELTDSDAGTAMFGNETLSPGVVVDRCIEVTYTGVDDAQPVLLYAAATVGDLSPYLDLTIELGLAAAGSFGGCGSFVPDATVYDGTLAGFAADHAGYATGRPTWVPDSSRDARSFRFRLAVQDVPAASGKSATFGFTWRTEGA
jgi:hypothetical protein